MLGVYPGFFKEEGSHCVKLNCRGIFFPCCRLLCWGHRHPSNPSYAVCVFYTNVCRFWISDLSQNLIPYFRSDPIQQLPRFFAEFQIVCYANWVVLLKRRSTVQINMIKNDHFWEIYKFSTYQFRSGANNCILWTLPSPGSHRFTIQTCPQVKHFFQPKNLTTWNARHIELVYTMRRLDPNYSFDVMSGWVGMPEYTFFLYSFCRQISYVTLQKFNNFRNFVKNIG